MITRVIGGVLLIVGTSIGGGMLALPVANAAMGFWPSTGLLLLCWALMTAGALFIVEANLYLPPHTHMLSMAEATLGIPGLVIAWLSYLFLLYTLLSAYISGGADVLANLLLPIHIRLNSWEASSLFTVFFGIIVYGGIKRVDWFNRLLMFGKLGAYCVLILLIFPFIQFQHLEMMHFSAMNSVLMLLMTSFGFAIIVPNLRDYFNDDVKTLKKVVLIGSLIPLFCYIAWDAVIMGTLSPQGDNGLATLITSEHTTSELALMLSGKVQNTLISNLFNFFTSICMLTAFLGVALCLISFLADGFKLEQKGWGGGGLFMGTFLPPPSHCYFFSWRLYSCLKLCRIFLCHFIITSPRFDVFMGPEEIYTAVPSSRRLCDSFPYNYCFFTVTFA